MAEEEKKKSFWETLPGIITALAALLGGVAAVIAALNGGGAKEKADPPPVPAAKPAAAQVLPADYTAAQQAAAEEIRKAHEEAEAAKAEAERAQAEAAAAKARAAEMEREAEKARVEAEQKKIAQAAEPKQGDILIDDVTGMKLVYIPSGCFNMGSSPDEEGHDDDEGPAHEVCVDGFYMGKYEVTQRKWEKIMGANPSVFKKGGNYPVEKVSWEDAQKFIEKLNGGTGRRYRLPTEAEWEHACRAGGSSTYCGGDAVDAVAWHDKNSGGSTHPVGERKENAFGLHDMSGNVWEWCADWYDSGYYASSPKDNPQGSATGSFRVVRGGSWTNTPRNVRAAYRYRRAPDSRSSVLGFRLLLPGQQDQAGSLFHLMNDYGSPCRDAGTSSQKKICARNL